MKFLLMFFLVVFMLVGCEKEQPYGRIDNEVVELRNVRLRNYGSSENFCGYILQNYDGGNLLIYQAISIPDSLKVWQGNARYEMKVKLLNEYTICQDPLGDPIGNDYPADVYQMVEVLDIKRK